MDNIVESLFGLTPFQVQQQQNAGLNQAADHYANQDPFQRATGGMFRAGGMLGGAGAQAMGMVNPAVEQAKLTEAMMASGGDLSTSQGLMAKSQQFAAAGDQRTALKLALAGKAKEKEEQAMLIARQKEALAERKQDYIEKEAMDFKKEQLKQQYDLAKERAADSRLAAADRVAAQREATAARLQMMQMGMDMKQSLIDSKKETKDAETAKGLASVDDAVMSLKGHIDELKKGGGMTSTDNGVLGNMSAYAKTTGVGQMLGSMGGTTNQRNRDSMLMTRPLLLASIMKAQGMSAKQMDSNTELKLWLSTATDPTKGYEANVEALNSIAKKYGSGAILEDSNSKGKGLTQAQSEAQAAIAKGADKAKVNARLKSMGEAEIP